MTSNMAEADGDLTPWRTEREGWRQRQHASPRVQNPLLQRVQTSPIAKTAGDEALSPTIWCAIAERLRPAGPASSKRRIKVCNPDALLCDTFPPRMAPRSDCFPYDQT